MNATNHKVNDRHKAIDVSFSLTWRIMTQLEISLLMIIWGAQANLNILE